MADKPQWIFYFQRMRSVDSNGFNTFLCYARIFSSTWQRVAIFPKRCQYSDEFTLKLTVLHTCLGEQKTKLFNVVLSVFIRSDYSNTVYRQNGWRLFISLINRGNCGLELHKKKPRLTQTPHTVVCLLCHNQIQSTNFSLKLNRANKPVEKLARSMWRYCN